MKLIIPLTGYATQLQTLPTAQPLLHICGAPVLAHLLGFLSDLAPERVIFIVDASDEPVKAWLAAQAVQAIVPFELVQTEAADSLLPTLWAARAWLDEKPLLLISGASIVQAPFQQLAGHTADVLALVYPDTLPYSALRVSVDATSALVDLHDWTHPGDGLALTGALWLQRGAALKAVLADAMQSAEYASLPNYIALLRALQQTGRPIGTLEATLFLDVTTPQALLWANERLLSLGHGSQDAIERSYSEDFTVLPPVFIHPTAVVENAVVGPFVDIAAEAVVRDCVVRNTLIAQQARVERVVLRDAILSPQAQINGRWQRVRLGTDELA